jgi:hypothetical protein
MNWDYGLWLLASSTAAVESSATAAVESATGDVAVESSASCCSAAVSTCYCYSTAIAVTVRDWAAIYWASSIVATSVSVATAISVAAAEPGAGSDEEATGEPAGAVVSVGRAGVGRVAVVAIGADWRAISVAAVVRRWSADADADRDLGVGETGWENQDAE